MYHLKRIVVSVNLIDLDEEVIRYASIVSQIMDADTLYFVHIAETLNLPENLDKEYRDVLAPIDETIKHQVQGTVDKYFSKQKNTQCSIDILEGSPPTSLLNTESEKTLIC